MAYTRNLSKLKNYLIEYIGLKVLVVSSPSRERIGINGLVIDETKNTFSIETGGERVAKVPKKNSVFRFTKEGKNFEIAGSRILYRPEERIKKVLKG